MSARHLSDGRKAEKIAVAWLRRNGLQLLLANFHCRYGELDLVMRDGACLAVIEVRYRKSSQHGGALGSITRSKQLRIGRTTQSLLQRHPAYRALTLRFDVLAISGELHNPTFDWRKQAFCFDAGTADTD